MLGGLLPRLDSEFPLQATEKWGFRGMCRRLHKANPLPQVVLTRLQVPVQGAGAEVALAKQC